MASGAFAGGRTRAAGAQPIAAAAPIIVTIRANVDLVSIGLPSCLGFDGEQAPHSWGWYASPSTSVVPGTWYGSAFDLPSQ